MVFTDMSINVSLLSIDLENFNKTVIKNVYSLFISSDIIEHC